MNFKMTQKERMLLEDQKKHEQLCIQKYQSYASQTQDPQLQQLFRSHALQEQEHLNTINQLLNGQIPSISQQNSSQPQYQQMSQQQGAGNQADAYLCNDLLSTEKYVSSTYDTAIFEFTNPQVRQILNHLQNEEQKHGEEIFLYMQSHGMYNPQ